MKASILNKNNWKKITCLNMHMFNWQMANVNRTCWISNKKKQKKKIWRKKKRKRNFLKISKRPIIWIPSSDLILKFRYRSCNIKFELPSNLVFKVSESSFEHFNYIWILTFRGYFPVNKCLRNAAFKRWKLFIRRKLQKRAKAITSV